MRIQNRTYYIIVIVTIILFSFTIFYYATTNNKLRIEYEQKVQLPSSASNLEIKSSWWIPRSTNLGQHVFSSFIINKSEFDSFLSQYKKNHLEKGSLIYSIYSAPSHIEGASLTIQCYFFNDDFVYIRLDADYN